MSTGCWPSPAGTTTDDGEALPWELLHDLVQLVPCDLFEASGQDTPHWDFFAEQLLPAEDEGSEADEHRMALYRMHYWRSACSYPDRSGDTAAVFRVSDLMSRREHHDSPLYVELARPEGLEHEMMVCLDAGAPQRTVRLLFCRGPGSDFSERDVAVLTLLQSAPAGRVPRGRTAPARPPSAHPPSTADPAVRGRRFHESADCPPARPLRDDGAHASGEHLRPARGHQSHRCRRTVQRLPADDGCGARTCRSGRPSSRWRGPIRRPMAVSGAATTG